MRSRRTRLWLGLGLAAALVGAAFFIQYEYPTILNPEQLKMIPVLLLVGIPGFYLLTFASLVEESMTSADFRLRFAVLTSHSTD